MINIWGCNVNDETCRAIGEFTIAWAQFELTFFNNNYTAVTANQISVRKTTNETALIMENVRKALLDYANNYYGQKSLVDRLCIRPNEKNYVSPITDFLSDKYSTMTMEKKVIAAIYIGSRVRNNMLHGLKDIATLDDQIRIFESLSIYLVHIITACVIDTGIYPTI